MTPPPMAEPAGASHVTRPWGFYALILLMLAEVVLARPVYWHYAPFNCWKNWPTALCFGFKYSVIGIYTTVAGLALLAMLLPAERRILFQDAGLKRRPLLLNLAGVAIFLSPALLLRDGIGTQHMVPILLGWFLGAALAASGLLLMLAPLDRWRAFLRQRGGILVACLIAGLAAPYFAQTVMPLWRVGAFSDATFHAVVWLMTSMGAEVRADFAELSIGDETFRANVAPACSGVEGIALIVFFVTMYLVLFRRELRFPAALLLYPVGIVASWLLNVVRIAALIAIAVDGNPELAVNGFHSHAGWLMFTVLSLCIVILARYSGFFAKAPDAAERTAPPLAPFLADPVVAQILPFAIFMASALLASTFATMPTLIYPLRAAAMAAGLLIFLPYLRSLTWRIDPIAVAVGLGVGIVWAATSPPAAESDLVLSEALGQLSQTAFLAWVASRVIGTIILVPIIEELFFRGYLLRRLAGDDRLIWRVVLGVVVSSVLFGALHDRWLLAFVAGALYAGLKLRSGRVSDAIVAHMASNAWIAGAAILGNDWSLI